MASRLTCSFCQKRTHTDALCVLNPGSQNFKKDLVCQTCGVRGHSSKVCSEAIRAAVKNTGNKPFPNYSVEIAEMLREEVEDMRIRLPLVVNDLCAEVMYDMRGTEDWRVYVDNMLVLYEGEDVVEFVHQVKRLVEKLTAMGMKLKLAKCKVGYTKMRILGHLCEKGSAQIDPEKVKCFSKMERPKSLQVLRSLLGFLNYVRDYVPLISDLLGPFQELAKRRKWDDSLWGEEMDDLFQRVQQVLESAPVLSAPDFAEPFILAMDASQYGVGAVLYQKIRGVVKFVRFGAKSLKKGQKNYPAPKRELLVLLFGLKRWGELLQPQRFTVEVDHKALIHLWLERSYMARDWMNYVAGYDFVVTHCLGVQHVLPHHLLHLYGILPGGKREERERVYEEKRKEGEVRRREEAEERRAKRGGQREERGELVEIAEMTTRAMRRREKGKEKEEEEGEEGKGEKGKEKEEEEGEEGKGEKGKEKEKKEGEGVREEAGQGGVGRGGGEAEGRENEKSGESLEEGEKRAVGLVEVGGGLQGALRSLEKVFGELVLGAKWVEEGALRKKLVRESHVETHEGEFHLFWRLLKRGFFWKDMRKDCRAEVRCCVDCLRFNVGARGFMPLRVRSVKLLMVEVYGDHAGPFPESGARGYKYILILVDAATRFVWLVPVVGVSGKETKEALEGVFRTVGWPGTLVTDGGSAFKNKDVSELLEGEDVEHQVCTPGVHEQNVPVERCVKEVRAILNKKCELRREGWSEVVLRVQEGLNTRLVKPLGSMPFDLFFARSPEMRREGRGEVEVSESELENAVRIGDRNEVMVKVVYPEVAEKVKKVREEVCKSKNRKRKKGKRFKEGEKVMVRVERQCKQDPFFEGPFVVRGFEEKKAEYQLARVGEEEVRVRTRHENLRGVGEVEEEGEDEVFEVTRVEGVRGEGEEKEFLVKWKGYRERTWEKEVYLKGAEQRVREFFRRKRRNEKRRERRAV